MPYKDVATFAVRRRTKQLLDRYRKENEPWDDYFNKIVRMIDKKVRSQSSSG